MVSLYRRATRKRLPVARIGLRNIWAYALYRFSDSDVKDNLNEVLERRLKKCDFEILETHP